MIEIGFDVISDLHLSPNDNFKWTNKATSLYCVVAGNVSSDTRTIIQTLGHLAKYYQGVFYIPGKLEYEGFDDIDTRTEKLVAICEYLENVVILYHNVAMIDGVALVGINGWGDLPTEYELHNIQRLCEREDDLLYLNKTIEKLQRHLDVKKIVIASSIVPKKELYFGQEPENLVLVPHFDSCTTHDTEKKLSHWIYGTYENVVDITIDNINYVNNSYYKRKNYWAKRITVVI
jgi:hypothetical protein